MMKNCLIFAVMLGVAGTAYAQQNESPAALDPVMKSRQAIERAINQARVMQNGSIQAGPKSGLSIEELRKTKGVDPSALAARYQSSQIGTVPAQQSLMVFISTSMPIKALVMLGQQAHATGAVLVLRGLRGALGTKMAIQKTMEFLQPVAATGANIQIDPESFGRYNVTVVPTFVIATKEDSCSTDQCDTKSYSLAGDVTLQYALEQWSNRGGAIGSQADMYLARLERTAQ